jgi:hypothetical protein
MLQYTDRELQLRQTLRDDFSVYAGACLKIRTKAGDVQPLRLNRSQRYLHERLEAQRRRTGRVRALVLKGRQVGISTYIAGRAYWRTTHSRGYRTYILAHLDDASSNLFHMAKRFHENVPELVRPETGAANAKELSFAKLDSGYKVATAGSQAVGRSDTIQFFHGSEMAFWPNAEDHSAGIAQAIADTAGSEDIRESTANGIGNAFHALWKAAERGDSAFEAIFIPWFWHEEYATPPEPGWQPPAAFLDYEEAYGLKRDQIFWAWTKNRDLSVVAGGSPDEINWKFRQEYPANADEAFQTSGAEAFISPEAVLRARKATASPYGPIILGIDPARGGGDKTGIIDRQGRVLGGHVMKRLDIGDLMELAGTIVNLVKEIEPAKVLVDTTGLGAGLYDRLRELLGTRVEGVNFGNKAYDAEHYANRRAEMWDLMRQWFEDPAGVKVPDDDAFQGDVCAIIRGPGATRFRSTGQLILEDKDHIKERLRFSPDLADAAALTFGLDMSLANPVSLDIPTAAAPGADWMGV